MNTRILRQYVLAGLALAFCTAFTTAFAAPIIKADNTNALGGASSWVGGVAPGASDVATWSGSYSASENNPAGLTNSLRAVWSGTALSWQGIAVGSLSGTALTTNTFYAGTSGFGAETNIQAAAQVGNIVTITTRAAHGFAPGMSVTIAGVTPAGYNGTFTVLGVPSGTTFTYSTGSGLTAGTAFGTVEGAIYIGGTGIALPASSLTIGSSGIDLSAASHSVVVSATNSAISTLGFAFAGNQTWNVPAGRNLRLGGGGISAATAKIISSGSDGIIDITGGGVVDANQGGASGFADATGFTGFTGKWRVNSGATLRGLRNGATAWGSNPAADSILLNGGTLAVGGMSGAVGNWTWTNGITLASSTTSYIDDQNVAGTGRSLLLNGVITGSGTVVFRESLVGATTFTSADLGFVLTGPNTMSGSVVIGGPVENGVAGRLSFVRVGGVGGSSTGLGIGANGTLGSASSIVNNGVLTFSLNTGYSVPAPITGSGSVRIGLGATTPAAGAEAQNITLTGANTYSGDTTINIGTLTLASGATLPNSANIFIVPRTGGSLIASTLDVTASGLSLNSGQRIVGGANNLGGNNTAQIVGNVTSGTGTAIVPGGTNVVNALAISGDLTLSGGATLVYDLNSLSSGDLLTVSGNVNPSGVTTFAITPPPGGLAAGNYVLLTASGTLGGSAANFAHNLVSAGRGQTFNIVYNGNNVELQVVGSPASLVWVGGVSGNTWDTHNGTSGTTNWLNGASPDAFFTTDAVLFDDSGSNTPAINLTGSLQPATATVAASQNYTFAGTGRLSGTGILTNAGPGTLTMLTSNDFTGKTYLTGGRLVITNQTGLGANPAASTADSVTFDGGTLAVNAAATFSQLNRGITIAAGNGTVSNGFALTVSNTVAGVGSLTKQGAGTLTMAGSNTYTGGTIISDGQVTYANKQALGRGASTSGTSGFWGKPFTLRQGIVELNGQTSYDANFVGGSDANGFPVMLYDGPITFGGTGGTSMLFRDTGGAATNGWGNQNNVNTTIIIYDATGNPGTATIAARLGSAGTSGTSTRVFDVGDSSATSIELDITGDMGVAIVNSTNQDGRNVTLVKENAGTVRVSALNNFPGWLVNNGLLLVNHAQALGMDRTIANGVSGGTGSPNTLGVAGGVVDLNGFSFGLGAINDNGSSSGTIRNNGGSAATLTVGVSFTNNVSGSYGGVIENGSGGVALVKVGTGTQTLGGANTYTGGTTVSNGTLNVNGSLVNGATVRAGGTLGGSGSISGVVTVDAGGTLSPGTSIGTITLNSSPVLNGAVRAEVNRNDGVTFLADQVAVPGNPITYNGTLVITNSGAPLQLGDTFTVFNAASYSGSFAIVSQTPGQVVVWNTSNLATTGTISVGSVSPAPITAVVSGSNLNLSWPLEALGAQLQVQTNSLSVGISTNWSGVTGSTGVNALSVPIDAANPSVFLRLAYPPQ